MTSSILLENEVQIFPFPPFRDENEICTPG